MALVDALGLLERLAAAAQDGGRGGSVLEIVILQALAHQAGGDLPAAYAKLGVTSRRAAVRQAHDLNLLPSQHRS